jgi:hypothetical protein
MDVVEFTCAMIPASLSFKLVNLVGRLKTFFFSRQTAVALHVDNGLAGSRALSRFAPPPKPKNTFCLEASQTYYLTGSPSKTLSVSRLNTRGQYEGAHKFVGYEFYLVLLLAVIQLARDELSG